MKRKNIYRVPKDFPGFVPYVYYIKHKLTGLWYIGSKYSSNAHPDYFFKNYFTSSKLILEIIESEGVGNFEVQIRKTFNTAVEALSYERRLIEKTKAVKHPLSANIDNNTNILNAIQYQYPTRYVTNIKTYKCIRIKKDSPLPEGFAEGNLNKKGKKNDSSAGRVWFHDPETQQGFLLSSNEVPAQNLIRGRSSIDKETIKSISNSGKRIINDGINNKFIEEYEDIPEGFVLGSKTYSRQTGDKRFAVNNGFDTKFIKIGDPIPDGFVVGAHPKNNAPREKGKIAINNGIRMTYIRTGEQIPEGFVLGGMPRK